MSWRVEGTDILGGPIGIQTAKTIANRIYKHGYKPIKRGEYYHTIFLAMPDMLMNPYKAFFIEGGAGIEGKPPIEYTTGEKLWKAAGFTPTREAEAWKTQEIAREARQRRLEKIAGFAERYLQAKKRRKLSDIQDIRKDLRQYNAEERKKGKEGLIISWKNDIIRSASRREKAREKGYEERLPKYMRKYQEEIKKAYR